MTLRDGEGSGGRIDHESTQSLLTRIHEGDESARDELLERYLPVFRRWAHGRLPGHARDIAETDDLVQLSLIRALRSISGFENRREGAFLAYLRTTLMNLVRDEIGRSKKRPRREELVDHVPTRAASPLQHVIDRETFEAYETALGSLPEETREAVFMRFELGMSYPEIARAVEAPSANAIRMTISRARKQIVDLMKQKQRPPR